MVDIVHVMDAALWTEATRLSKEECQQPKRATTYLRHGLSQSLEGRAMRIGWKRLLEETQESQSGAIATK